MVIVAVIAVAVLATAYVWLWPAAAPDGVVIARDIGQFRYDGTAPGLNSSIPGVSAARAKYSDGFSNITAIVYQYKDAVTAAAEADRQSRGLAQTIASGAANATAVNGVRFIFVNGATTAQWRSGRFAVLMQLDKPSDPAGFNPVLDAYLARYPA